MWIDVVVGLCREVFVIVSDESRLCGNTIREIMAISGGQQAIESHDKSCDHRGRLSNFMSGCKQDNSDLAMVEYFGC